MEDKRIVKVINEWNDISDSDWYMSYRTNEVIREILTNPVSVFHNKTWEVIKNAIPNLKDINICVPSSGDNRAVLALAAMGANVTSGDICEKQLEHAKKIAEKNNLNIKFIAQDTMKLDEIESNQFDFVYTSEGVHVWINDLNSMYKNIYRILKKDGVYINYEIHPFTRPFAYEDGRPKDKNIVIQKPYEMTGPFDDGVEFHWRLQDILNAVSNSGLSIKRLEEMHDEKDKGHFWFYKKERVNMTREEIDEYYDWTKNPLAALPQWFTVCAKK
ncbi:class I SAM-dependent methyltransferase [Sedimentibacter sp. zth1]|uniref:class I SAM-dependent methyltransferase n=1 Tax=Sedimentibacter sp. zth1 TaxID=2816908 RepID=UPI001A92D939|nr:class I SAM-dependent methyltransferase [Sedimentibacter sp. zth1]QSX05116.1 class I SAM-dependent methyltransferase [Sedimentibacter sp. zth1]